LKTTNNGTNWTSQLIPQNISPNMTFTNVNFRNSTLGWAIGEDGVILKTTNSGEPIGIQNITTTMPLNFKLSQNYPNPFNPSTIIEFDLPRTANTNLIVYNSEGKEIANLVNQELSPGRYKVTFDGNNISSGVYF